MYGTLLPSLSLFQSNRKRNKMQSVGLLLLLQGTASWAFYLPGTVFTVLMYDKIYAGVVLHDSI